MRMPSRCARLALGAFAAAMTLGFVAIRTPLFARGLDVPFLYSHDGLFYLAQLQTLKETGGLGEATRLGAPFGMNWLDLPSCDFTHLLVLRALVAVSSAVVAFNVFYLLGFVTSAFSATLVARRERLHPLFAVAVGVVFALAPYHFLRLSHVFLASYAVVPFAVAAALDLLRGAPRSGRALANRRHAFFLGLAVFVLSGTGLYYAFFACALGVAATWRGAVIHPSRAVLRSGLFYVGTTVFGVAVQFLPTLARALRVGPANVAARVPWESELYGLKPIQLLLPTRGHSVHALARLADRYAGTSPLTNENTTAALGAIAALGLVAAVGALLLGAGRRRTRELGWVATFMIALGVIGGLGTLFAYVVHPGIRSVNRVSIVVAFASVLAAARVAQHLLNRARRPWLRRLGVVVVPLFALLVAGFDQIPQSGYRPEGEAARYARDARFFRSVERSLPRRARLLVYPFATFPEGSTRGEFGPYDGLRAFLHTRAIRVSAGSMTGRASDTWLGGLLREAPPARITEVVRGGFDAVLVGRVGLPRGARRDAFVTALGEPAMSNEDWLLFRLPARRAGGGPPMVASALGRGFLGWERLGHRRRGSWANGDAELLLVQIAQRSLVARVALRMTSIDARRVTFRVDERVVHVVSLAANRPTHVTFDVRLPRGSTRVRITSNRPAVDPENGDVRDLAFAVADLSTTALGPNDAR